METPHRGAIATQAQLRLELVLKVLAAPDRRPQPLKHRGEERRGGDDLHVVSDFKVLLVAREAVADERPGALHHAGLALGRRAARRARAATKPSVIRACCFCAERIGLARVRVWCGGEEDEEADLWTGEATAEPWPSLPVWWTANTETCPNHHVFSARLPPLERASF